jgi:NAD dependent epimerase/dehydratase family enzyme
MKTIGITGGTGFIGRHLTALLLRNGYKVTIFTTRAIPPPEEINISYAHWNAEKGECDTKALSEIDAIIHLAGAGIADKRWTAARKRQILHSRIKTTGFLISQIQAYATNCKTFVASSAIGFYGPDRGKTHFTENDLPYDDFLGNTCRQ